MGIDKKKPHGNKKLVYGVGINDADYAISSLADGKRVLCPYYSKWRGILMRCYSEDSRKRQPTYADCTIAVEWIVFSVFKAWMEKQEWEGKELDKDIIDPHNKQYGPSSCAFVTSALNQLVTHSRFKEGRTLPTGVWEIPRKKVSSCRFKASASGGVTGKTVTLGYHHTATAAAHAYTTYKTGVLRGAISEQLDTRIAAGLQLHCDKLWDDYNHYVNTGEVR